MFQVKHEMFIVFDFEDTQLLICIKYFQLFEVRAGAAEEAGTLRNVQFTNIRSLEVARHSLKD